MTRASGRQLADRPPTFSVKNVLEVERHILPCLHIHPILLQKLMQTFFTRAREQREQNKRVRIT